MSGWFDRHEDAPVPAAIDFAITCVGGVLMCITCPTCDSEYTTGGTTLMFGHTTSLINDHVRQHYPMGWGQKW
jgi:hypothetical protein